MAVVGKLRTRPGARCLRMPGSFVDRHLKLADLLGINRGRVVAHVLVSKTVKDLTAFLIVNRTSSVIGGHNPREDSGINGVPRCSETGPSTAWTECRSTRSTIGGFQAKRDVSC